MRKPCVGTMLFAGLLLLTASEARAAGAFGFGKVVKLGPKDELVRNEGLRVYSSDTVGFVFRASDYNIDAFTKLPVTELGRYKVKEDEQPVKGVKILGQHRTLYEMKYIPHAWHPRITQAIVFVRLPSPMKNGKSYTFNADLGSGAKVDVALKWSDTNCLSESIKVNQCGYLPDARFKLAYLGKWLGTAGAMDFAHVKQFEVIDLATGRAVHTGKPKLRHKAGAKNEGGYKEDFSGENVYGLDLGPVKTPGAYCIRVPGLGRSYSFRVADDAYAEALFTTVRSLYHQRCGVALEKAYTPWTRPVCKQHVKIAVMPEYAPFPNFKKIKTFLNEGKAAGNLKYKEVCGGYHDAGDFDRRWHHLPIANHLVAAYEMNPEAFIDNQFVIPESGNGIPDILDEARFGLSFYLDNQWPDGGIPGGSEAWEHPKNNLHKEGKIKKENAWMTDTQNESTEYVMLPVTRESCMGFAAAAAHLAVHLKTFKKDDAAKLLASAEKAYTCGKAKFPPKKAGHEWLAAHAAVRLLRATGKASYHDDLKALKKAVDGKPEALKNEWLWWAAAYVALPKDTPGVDPKLRQKLKSAIHGGIAYNVNSFALKKGYIQYKHPWAPFAFGSTNTVFVGQLALAWQVTKEKLFRDVLAAHMDFALGANAMGQVQCSGLGQKHIRNPLDLESMNDEFVEAVPGFWVFGPVKYKKDWFLKQWGPHPALGKTPLLYRFLDIEQSPSHSEFTVQSNSPMIMALAPLCPKNPKPYKGPLPVPTKE